MKYTRELWVTLFLVFAVSCAVGIAFGGDSIYIDTSGVNSIAGLTPAQQADLKGKIVADVQGKLR